MIIVFETHSTSLDNEVGVASGHRDVDLSPRGELQAATLGERRAHEHFDAVYVSDLRRSWRTAEIAFGGTGVRIIRDGRLRECDYGTMTGHSVAEIEAAAPSAVLTPFPEGESYAQVAVRVADWLNQVRLNRLARVLIIGHRATHYAIEHLVARVPLERAVAAPREWRPGWVYRG